MRNWDDAEGRRGGASSSVVRFAPTPFAAPKRSQIQLAEVAMQCIEPHLTCGPVLHRLPYSHALPRAHPMKLIPRRKQIQLLGSDRPRGGAPAVLRAEAW